MIGTDDRVIDFAGDLRRLRQRAGGPAYRVLARRANFAAATLAAAASGHQLPTLPVTLAYVEACGGDLREWRARWQAIAARSARESPVEGRSPYVGSAPFERDDAAYFFGRRRLVDDLVRLVARHPLVVVSGPSGVGKSSLVRAGLLPAVHAGTPGPTVVVPGTRGLTELAARLAAPAGARLVTWQACGAEPPGGRPLLVVDQFERLFAPGVDSGERAGFVTAVVRLSQDPRSRIRVVLVVRAEHRPRCAEFPAAHLPVDGMNPVELRDAVVKPAERAGARVEGALVSAIVAEVASRPGALPLAARALAEAWRHRRGSTVTLAGYESAGGVDGVITTTAEGVYGSFDEAQRRAARRVLLRMVDVGAAEAVLRRRVSYAEVDAGSGQRPVADHLVDARLLTAYQDGVEPAHEALIRAWPRLRGWVHEDLDGLRTHRELTAAAGGWEALDRDEGALYRGVRLAAASVWAERRRDALTAVEREFLDASVRLRHQEAAVDRIRRLVVSTGRGLASLAGAHRRVRRASASLRGPWPRGRRR